MIPARRFPDATPAEVYTLLKRMKKRLQEAKAARAQLHDVRDLIAATAVVHELEDVVSACSEHLCWHNNLLLRQQRERERWLNGKVVSRNLPGHAYASRKPSPAPTYVRGRDGGAAAPTGAAAERPAIDQVPQSQAMGQGWPASVGAGSAAVQLVQGGNDARLHRDDDTPPGDVFSSPSDERISSNILISRGIHYAKCMESRTRVVRGGFHDCLLQNIRPGASQRTPLKAPTLASFSMTNQQATPKASGAPTSSPQVEPKGLPESR